MFPKKILPGAKGQVPGRKAIVSAIGTTEINQQDGNI